MGEAKPAEESAILASSAVVEGEEAGEAAQVSNYGGLEMNNSLFGKRGSVGPSKVNPLNELCNPLNMRGSLNVGYRRHEMHRINEGNKKILQQLREVKPSIGSHEEWRRHEDRQNHYRS